MSQHQTLLMLSLYKHKVEGERLCKRLKVGRGDGEDVFLEEGRRSVVFLLSPVPLVWTLWRRCCLHICLLPAPIGRYVNCKKGFSPKRAAVQLRCAPHDDVLLINCTNSVMLSGNNRLTLYLAVGKNECETFTQFVRIC